MDILFGNETEAAAYMATFNDDLNDDTEELDEELDEICIKIGEFNKVHNFYERNFQS